jgi:catechol 2,3-dioxygenase-like lactoylglutathione lyase family enzyme
MLAGFAGPRHNPAVTAGIDHVLIATRDLDRAAAQFRRLGFNLTPRGHHTRLGSSNHCAMFQNRDYLELLGLGPERGRRPYYEDFLARREGIGGIAFRTSDAHGNFAALRAAGLAADEPLAFGRPVDLPGSAGEARFVTTTVDTRQTPGARVFFCQHETPELVWLPGFMGHPNGAQGLVGVTIVAEGPSLAETYGRILGSRPRRANDVTVFEIGKHRIEFIAPHAARERYAGDPILAAEAPYAAALRLAVGDRDMTIRLLSEAGVPFGAVGGTVIVPSSAAVGAILEFVG